MKNLNILLTLFAVIILFFNYGVCAQDMNKISLDGTWKFRKAGTMDWMDIKIPGEVHLGLLRNKIITDPYFRDNEQYQQWIGEIGWEYQKAFFIPDTLFIHRNIELVCKGLDTYANVFLNDSLILVADNMFRTWYANIKPLLRTGLNTLRIQFPSVVDENKRRYGILNYKPPVEEKSVCRKAAYHFGWENGPTFITSGIWQPIFIRYWDFVNVLGVQYVQKSLTDSLARLSVEFTMLSTLADSALLKVSVNGNDVAKRWTVLKKGTNVIVVDVEIKNPKRWWTNGLGEPYLYAFEHEVYFGKKLGGKGLTRIGLKTLEWVQKKDSIGHSPYFKLNGVPVFMKGAFYIPQDNFLTRVKDTNYRDIIRNAAKANMNMLRVWSGGIYEKDAFYDYCDENGILVWQDFMFPYSVYPGGKKFQENIQAEAIQNVVRLRNHTCIAMWCGNKEVDEVLKTAARSFDFPVPYISSTPGQEWGDVGGFQSFPELTSIGKYSIPGDIKFDSPVMKAHQKSSNGYERIDELLLQEYKKPRNLDSYAYVSQLLQAEKTRNSIEENRRAMRYLMGSLYWQLNDCWPGISRSSTDFYGKKKALWYCLKNEYAMTLVSPVIEDKNLRVYIISDNLAPQKAELTIELVDFSGKNLFSKSISVEIPANKSIVAFDTALSEIIKNRKTNEILLIATLKNGDQVISENLLYFDSPKNLDLKVPTIQKQVTEIPEGYKIELSTDQLAKNLFLKMPFKGELSENYFDLIPGRTKIIIYTTKTRFSNVLSLFKIISLADTY